MKLAQGSPLAALPDIIRTQLHSAILATDKGQHADSILRNCVHCGFCNAVCPTYLETGDELDGPRGRIYLIKNVLEENRGNATALHHLDRCLTCRACEAACPSGVAYGDLLEIGREQIGQAPTRPLRQRLLRLALAAFLPATRFGKMLYLITLWLRSVLPSGLRNKVPVLTPPRHYQPASQRQVNPTRPLRLLLLPGCIQSYTSPATLLAAKALLEHLGAIVSVAPATCCGAMHHHADMARWTKRLAMRNLALWSAQGQVDALVSLASGCGLHIKDYRRLFPAYTKNMAPVQDIAEVITRFDLTSLPPAPPTRPPAPPTRPPAGRPQRVAWHAPCTFVNGQKIDTSIPDLLNQAGYVLTQVTEGHLCCGSAGAYSLEQPALAGQLRHRKLSGLLADKPDLIATANIGCQLHLATGTQIPVYHWVELLASGLEVVSTVKEAPQ